MEENTNAGKKWSFFKFNPHSIRSKMVLGFVLAAVLFLIFIGITLYGMYGFVEAGKVTVKNYQPSIAHTHAMMKGTARALSLLKESVYRDDPALKEALSQVWQTGVTSHLDSLEEKAAGVENTAVEEQLNIIINKEKQLKEKFSAATSLPFEISAAADPLAMVPDSIRMLIPVLPPSSTVYYHANLDRHIQGEIEPALAEMVVATDAYTDLIETEMAEIEADTRAGMGNFMIIVALMFGVLVVLLASAIVFVPRSILKNIDQLKMYILTLSKGDFPAKLSTFRNELHEIVVPLKSFIDDLRNIKLFAQHVGNKDFDNEIRVFNDEGELGTSLAEMRSSLKKVAEEDKVRYWTNEGLAKFGEILRNNTNNLSEISEHIITNLVKYLNANQGGLFIYNDEQEEDKHLELKACYAFNRKKFVEKKVYPGQGLVGQCYLEEEYIYMTQVPEDYVEITSGLGDANPRSILIVPLKVNEEVYGIIEMASLQEFESHQIDFVLKISESIANTISSVKVNEKTQRLLENSQQMTEEMRAQEEEMRQNMEELQATQEEVERKGRELAEFTTAINKSSMIMELEPDGTIISVNEKFCDVMKYSSQDVVGHPESTIVPQEFIETGAYSERWSRLLREDYVESDVRRLKKDGSTMWMRAYYFPIKDDKLRVKKISCICSDITEEKNTLDALKSAQEEMQRKQQEVRQTEANLTSLINNTPDSIMTLDRNYKPVIVNETYQKQYKSAGIDLQGTVCMLDILEGDLREEWKGYYDRALAGEHFSIVSENKEEKKHVYREYFFNPIKNSRGEITGLSIFSKDITQRVNESKKSRENMAKHEKTIHELKAKLATLKN